MKWMYFELKNIVCNQPRKMFSPTSKGNSLAANVCVRKYDLILNLNDIFFLSFNSQYVLQALA